MYCKHITNRLKQAQIGLKQKNTNGIVNAQANKRFHIGR